LNDAGDAAVHTERTVALLRKLVEHLPTGRIVNAHLEIAAVFNLRDEMFIENMRIEENTGFLLESFFFRRAP